MYTIQTAPPLDADKLRELDSFICALPTRQGALIATLHEAQRIFGYLPRDLQLHVARSLGLPGAEVYGVVSFYSYFTMEQPGEHTVSVCMGTACFVRGAGAVLDAFKRELGVEANETTTDRKFTLKDVRCVGACGLAPVVTVDGKVFGRVSEGDVDGIIAQYRGEAGEKS